VCGEETKAAPAMGNLCRGGCASYLWWVTNADLEREMGVTLRIVPASGETTKAADNAVDGQRLHRGLRMAVVPRVVLPVRASRASGGGGILAWMIVRGR
jgi:hypothetical protein